MRRRTPAPADRPPNSPAGKKPVRRGGPRSRRGTREMVLRAQIGCGDAKETSWFVRPWQADPLITVVAAVGKPNHPAYPSGHSCLSASGADVLSTFFPEQRDHLNAMVTQAGVSRMYGGIHYRVDIEAGQALGHSVARFTIAADASGNSVLTPH